MCKLCKYVIIKDGVLCVLETDRMKEVIREMNLYLITVIIYLMMMSVYLLVKDLSVYDNLIILLFTDLSR